LIAHLALMLVTVKQKLEMYHSVQSYSSKI